jgi:hypothetical protein
MGMTTGGTPVMSENERRVRSSIGDRGPRCFGIPIDGAAQIQKGFLVLARWIRRDTIPRVHVRACIG